MIAELGLYVMLGAALLLPFVFNFGLTRKTTELEAIPAECRDDYIRAKGDNNA